MPDEWQFYNDQHGKHKDRQNPLTKVAYYAIFTWQVKEDAMHPELLVAGNKGQLDVHYHDKEQGTLQMSFAPVDLTDHAPDKVLKDVTEHIHIK